MPNQPHQADYLSVAAELQRKGAETVFQRQNQLVVATSIPHFPNTSNSFWLTFHKKHWHLVTWSPRVYRIPASADVVEVCLDCLRCATATITRVPDQLVEKFHLELLSDAEAEIVTG